MTALPQLRILALGDWGADQLHCSWTASSLAIPDYLLANIDTIWETTAARPGIHLFDGPLCRLEHYLTSPTDLQLKLSATSYKIFMGTNGTHPQWAELYGEHVMANPVGTSVLLQAHDGTLIAGQRNHSVALYAGCAHPFGGALEPGNNGQPPELMAEILRELGEEVHIKDEEIIAVRAMGLVEDRQLRQPELIFIATTTLSLSAIAERLDPSEHNALWHISDQQSAIEDALQTNDTLTPVLAATLLAYGRWRFGEAWLLTQLTDQHQDDRDST